MTTIIFAWIFFSRLFYLCSDFLITLLFFSSDLPVRCFYSRFKCKTPEIHSTLICLLSHTHKHCKINSFRIPDCRHVCQFIILLRIFIWLCKMESEKKTHKINWDRTKIACLRIHFNRSNSHGISYSYVFFLHFVSFLLFSLRSSFKWIPKKTNQRLSIHTTKQLNMKIPIQLLRKPSGYFCSQYEMFFI